MSIDRRVEDYEMEPLLAGIQEALDGRGALTSADYRHILHNVRASEAAPADPNDEKPYAFRT